MAVGRSSTPAVPADRDQPAGLQSLNTKAPGERRLPTTRRALVFANPVAPNADPTRLRAALDREFGAQGYRVVETRADEAFAAEVDRELIQAAEMGADLVVAVGGDGTVSLIAEALHRIGTQAKGVVLAMVPCGTANILARELKVPSAIDDAVALAAARPAVVPLDALASGDRLFLTQVGVGLNATIVRDTSRESQQRFKRLSYMATLARRVLGHGTRMFRIRVDGQVLRVRAWEVTLANASTLGSRPFDWGPNIDPTDGIADLCLFQTQRVRDLFQLAWMACFGWDARYPHARFVSVTKEVEIKCEERLPVHGDGESLGTTPVQLSVIRAAVHVIVPGPVAEAVAAEPVEVNEAHAAESPAAKPKAAEAPHRRAWLGARWARERKRVGDIDTAAYLAINRLNGGAWVDRLLVFSSRVLDWGELWVVIALLAAVWSPAQFARLPLLVVPPLWLAMLTVNFPIKSMFRRRRPFLLHERARLVGRRPKDSSFPSGHTAAAFVGAALLSPHLPALSPVFYGWAVVVAFSRVYLGVHFPADVLVGGITGSLIATLYGWLWALIIARF